MNILMFMLEMSWAEYWANEGVYAAGDTESSADADSRNEYDKGAFDAVTRATANHGFTSRQFPVQRSY